MAVVAVDGGDELRSVAACEKQRRGGGARRVREGARGCVAMLEGPWRRGGSKRWPGKQEVAEAASAPVGHARCLLARGRRQEEVGWAALGRSCWPLGGLRGEHQVSALFYISVLFSIFFKFVLPLF